VHEGVPEYGTHFTEPVMDTIQHRADAQRRDPSDSFMFVETHQFQVGGESMSDYMKLHEVEGTM